MEKVKDKEEEKQVQIKNKSVKKEAKVEKMKWKEKKMDKRKKIQSKFSVYTLLLQTFNQRKSKLLWFEAAQITLGRVLKINRLKEAG